MPTVQTGYGIWQDLDALVTEQDLDFTDDDGNTYWSFDKDGNVKLVGNVDITMDPDDDTVIDVGADVLPTGTVWDFAYDTAETLTGDLIYESVDLKTNVTPVNDGDITGHVLKTPAFTCTGDGINQYMRGYSVESPGALVVNDAVSGTAAVTWTGFYAQLPAITQTAGSMIARGAYIIGGTVTSGTARGIEVDMAASTDTAIMITQGYLWIADGEKVVLGTDGDCLYYYHNTDGKFYFLHNGVNGTYNISKATGKTTFNYSVGLSGNIDANLNPNGSPFFDIGADVFATGTVIDFTYDTAETLTGDLIYQAVDLSTNLTYVNDGDVTGFKVQTAAFTATGDTVTQYIRCFSIESPGALDVNDGVSGATIFTWDGYYVAMPAITQTAGDMDAYGVRVVGGAVTSGAAWGAHITMNASTDTALWIGKGYLWIADGEKLVFGTNGVGTDVEMYFNNANTRLEFYSGNAIRASLNNAGLWIINTGMQFNDGINTMRWGNDSDIYCGYDGTNDWLEFWSATGPTQIAQWEKAAKCLTIMDDIYLFWGDDHDALASMVTGTNIFFIERNASSMLGVTGGIAFGVNIGAGGAAAAQIYGAVDILDGTWESGLIAETDGAGSYREPVFKIPYQTGDYGGNHAAPSAPTPTGLIEGCMYSSYDTDAGNAGANAEYALFIYMNGGYRKVVLT